MNRRDVNKSKYLAAFLTATFIFLLGIGMGHYFSLQKLESIDNLAQEMRLSTMGAELQFELISERPCDFINSSELTEELYQIGSRLDFMESEMGQTNEQVLALKEYYHLLELRHWLFLKKAKDECKQEYDLVFYFYSNKGDCPKCNDQGGVLTYLHKKYPSLNIYSFDYNIDNPALRTIKSLYGIEGELPAIVVNDNTFNGFMNSVALEKELDYRT